MGQASGSSRLRSRGGSRQHALLPLERAVLNGDFMEPTILLKLPPADIEASPLLAKACGEAHVRSGNLKDGLALLSCAVKGLAAQGLQRHMLEALAVLATVRIRTGSLAEAGTIVRFLREEFDRSLVRDSGCLAHALAYGDYLLEGPSQAERYLHAAFDAYAQEPRFTPYGALLLDVWTGLVPPDQLPCWDGRAAWAEQQVRLGRASASYVRCIRGLNAYHEGRWDEAAGLLEQGDDAAAALGSYHALLMRVYRFRACCRSDALRGTLAERTFRELEQALQAVEADLTLRFHAELLRGEWLLLIKSDRRGAAEAKRHAEVAQQLTRLPDHARMLAALHECVEQTAAPARPTPAQPAQPQPWSAAGAGAPRVWRIYCFGVMRLAREGAEVVELVWKRKKTRELFVYLLLQPGYAAPRDRVVELLFANAEPGKAVNRLYVAIHELRGTLLRQLGLADAVALKEGIVRLSESAIEYLDVEQYSALARVGKQLWRQDRELALEMFDQASQLYDGLLPEIPYVEWLDSYREALAETQAYLLRRLTEQASAERKLDRAQSYIAEWLRIQPMQEEAHYEMIALLVHSGRRAEALNWYRKWERVCREELGVLPMQETRQLIAGTIP